MEGMVLLGLVLLGLFLWWIAAALRRSLKSQQAHTELRKAPRAPSRPSVPSVPSAPVAARKPTQTAQPESQPVAAVEAAAPSGNNRARVTYVKADSSRSDWVVTLYSRVAVNGVTQAINVR